MSIVYIYNSEFILNSELNLLTVSLLSEYDK